MLRVQDLTKYFADQLLFKSVSFVIDTREKVGLIGSNGSGKSTLLRILCGDIHADNGSVDLLEKLRLSYLPQQLASESTPLSSGQKRRLELSRLFKENASILILDEPTNNLDEESLRWLENTIIRQPCACIIVSHDRTFLDRVTTRTLELDALSKTVKNYSGNYSWYRSRKQQELERQWKDFNEQQDRMKQLRRDIRTTKQQALSIERETTNDFFRGKAKRIAATAKARETRLNRMISSENKIEKPRELERARLAFTGVNMHSARLVKFENVSFSYDHKKILDCINFELRGNSRILLRGVNGAGKSTLLKLLTGDLMPSSGQVLRRPDLKLAVLMQEQEANQEGTLLSHFLNYPSNNLNDSDARTFLHRFQFSGDDVFKPFHGFNIQMVGWFIENHQFHAARHKAGKR